MTLKYIDDIVLVEDERSVRSEVDHEWMCPMHGLSSAAAPVQCTPYRQRCTALVIHIMGVNLNIEHEYWYSIISLLLLVVIKHNSTAGHRVAQ